MAGLFVLVQLIGFLLLLTAFASMQLVGLPSGSRVNFVLNLVGASLLAVDALYDRQWAFLPSSADGPWFRSMPSSVPIEKTGHVRPRIAAQRQGRGRTSASKPTKAEPTVCKVADYTEVDLHSPYVLPGEPTKRLHWSVQPTWFPARPWNAAMAGGPFASKGFSIFRSSASWRRLPPFLQTRA